MGAPAWPGGPDEDALSDLELHVARSHRTVAEDDTSCDWGWCIACRRPWAPSHACRYPRVGRFRAPR